MKVLVAQLCLTLWDPMDCSPPGSSVHGILQARILDWLAISFSRGSSRPSDWTQVSCIAGDTLPLSHQGSPIYIHTHTHTHTHTHNYTQISTWGVLSFILTSWSIIYWSILPYILTCLLLTQMMSEKWKEFINSPLPIPFLLFFIKICTMQIHVRSHTCYNSDYKLL